LHFLSGLQEVFYGREVVAQIAQAGPLHAIHFRITSSSSAKRGATPITGNATFHSPPGQKSSEHSTGVPKAVSLEAPSERLQSSGTGAPGLALQELVLHAILFLI
jgi:hypothetical protein